MATDIENVPPSTCPIPNPEPRRRDPEEVPVVTLRSLETVDLLDIAVNAGLKGPAWGEIQRRLFEATFPQLAEQIRNGCIFRRAARAGYHLVRRPALLRDTWPAEIAAESVEACLRRFEQKVIPSGEWDPERGISLEEFFMACCIPDFANAWKRYLRLLPDYEISLDSLLEAGTPRLQVIIEDRSADPSEIAGDRSGAIEEWHKLSDGERRVIVLEARGWSRAEIGRALSISTNAVDARISRLRKRLDDKEGTNE